MHNFNIIKRELEFCGRRLYTARRRPKRKTAPRAFQTPPSRTARAPLQFVNYSTAF